MVINKLHIIVGHQVCNMKRKVIPHTRRVSLACGMLNTLRKRQ